MVLGCILCRQPLVNYTNLKDKKRHYYKGKVRPLKTATPAEKEVSNEAKKNQLVLSKCGHLFHKNCLKTYLSTQPKGSGTKRECPFCFKVVTLAQTIPVYLNVNSDDLLVEKVSAICRHNDELHEKLTGLKADLAQKQLELKSLNEDLDNHRENIRLQAEEIKRSTQPSVSIKSLKKELSLKEKYVKSLSDQNSKLVSLIEKQATRNQLENPKTKNSTLKYQTVKESATPTNEKFRSERRHQNIISSNSENDRDQTSFNDKIQDSIIKTIKHPSGKTMEHAKRQIDEEKNRVRQIEEDQKNNENPRPIPKGAKYLEYRERQILAQQQQQQEEQGPSASHRIIVNDKQRERDSRSQQKAVVFDMRTMKNKQR